jgi:hypothetical protein
VLLPWWLLIPPPAGSPRAGTQVLLGCLLTAPLGADGTDSSVKNALPPAADKVAQLGQVPLHLCLTSLSPDTPWLGPEEKAREGVEHGIEWASAVGASTREDLTHEEAQVVAEGPEDEVHDWNWGQLGGRQKGPICCRCPGPEVVPARLNPAERVEAWCWRTAVTKRAAWDTGLRSASCGRLLAAACSHSSA